MPSSRTDTRTQQQAICSRILIAARNTKERTAAIRLSAEVPIFLTTNRGKARRLGVSFPLQCPKCEGGGFEFNKATQQPRPCSNCPSTSSGLIPEGHRREPSALAAAILAAVLVKVALDEYEKPMEANWAVYQARVAEDEAKHIELRTGPAIPIG